MVLLASTSVTFTSCEDPTASRTAMCLLFPASRDLRDRDMELLYQWAVAWDSGLSYVDGTMIGERDRVQWTDANGTPRSGVLRQSYGTMGMLAQQVAFIEEPVG